MTEARVLLFRNREHRAASWGREVSAGISWKKNISRADQCDVYKANMKNEMHEMGIWFNLFIVKITEVVGKTANLSRELFTSSDELSKTIGDFSENANTQASSAEEIMATVEALVFRLRPYIRAGH